VLAFPRRSLAFSGILRLPQCLIENRCIAQRELTSIEAVMNFDRFS
jgi:hypothetical protein